MRTGSRTRTPIQTTTGPELLASELMPLRERFLGFVRRRVADPALAEDVVQEAFLKAVSHSGQLRAGESVVPWFYRILRRSIVDLYRRKAVRDRVFTEMPETLDLAEERELKTEVCACLRVVLPTLKPEYAQAIEQVDLGELPAETAARVLGIERNNLKTRLHRARRQLRERLLQSCGVCASHGCLDCDCQRKVSN